MAGLWMWTVGCLALSAVSSLYAWWLAKDEADRWRNRYQQEHEAGHRLRDTARELFEQRNLAQAQLVERGEDVTAHLVTIGRLQAERDEARSQLAMTLRRDPMTGRFMRREADNGRALQH